MHSMIRKFAISAVFVAGASAATHRIEVGQSGLKYTPDTIEADEGDIVEFHFNSMHTVVAGDFNKPCTPVASGGFYSGSLPMGDESFFSIIINDTNPVFFYCSIDSHCQGGMVGVINQGSDTLDAFRSAAENSEESTSPDAPFGGTIGSGSISVTSATTATESSSTSTSGSTRSQSATTEITSTGGATNSLTPSTPSPTTVIQPGVAGHLKDPTAGLTGLVLVILGMLAF